MGSSQCCHVVQDEKRSELVVGSSDTMKSSSKMSVQASSDLSKSKIKGLQKPSPPQQKLPLPQNKNEEPSTPGFAEMQSLNSKQSKQSEQSNKDIKLVAEIVLNMDVSPKPLEEQDQDEDPLQSQCSYSKKKKNDTPLSDFQQKNSLKQFDTKRLNKLKSLSDHKPQNDDRELDSQRSQSIDNRSVKSILKQELKFSQFRKNQGSDLHSHKKVHFELQQD